MDQEFHVVDLFSGAGGMSNGFENAGFNILMGIDHFKAAIDTFSANHKTAETILGDIREIKSSEILEKIGNKKISVIIGGPPCQGFSMAGQRDPKDPRNSLFMEFVRFVDNLDPKIFVMENVPGLLNSKNANGEKVIEIIEKEFRKIGYHIKYRKLNSADYGVPQKCNRVIIIGSKEIANISFPDPSHSEHPFKGFEGQDIKRWIGVGEVLLSKDEVDPKYFHTPKMIEGFVRRKEKNMKAGKGFGAQYLKMDKPSYTISARYWKDGSDALVKYNEKEIRMLTELELKRIQSFPDDFVFLGNKKDIHIQIGNAVPPKLAEAIAIKIREKIEKP